MSVFDNNVTHSLSFSQTLDIEYGDPYYGTIIGGNIYFSKRLRTEDWELASDEDKQKALFEATYMIDRLNYKGDRTNTSQKLQFPRDGDTVVPRDIEYAAYEVAIMLLGGLDPEAEVRNQEISTSKFAGVTTQYHPTRSPLPYVMAGIHSAKAWRFLFPYLRLPGTVSLVRIN